MRIWKCPDCGAGLRAPDKPAKDDVRRFCFPCSTRAGHLVRRICPAIESKRARAREVAKTKRARKAKTRARAQAKADARGEVPTSLIRREFARLLKLKAWEGAFDRRVPEFSLRRGTKPYSCGTSWGGRITASIPWSVDRADAWTLMVHELAHEGQPRRIYHAHPWRAMFVEAAREAYGIEFEDEGLRYPLLHLALERVIRAKLEARASTDKREAS